MDRLFSHAHRGAVPVQAAYGRALSHHAPAIGRSGMPVHWYTCLESAVPERAGLISTMGHLFDHTVIFRWEQRP